MIINSIGMKLVYIPPGEFMMGSPEDEEGHYDEEGPDDYERQHLVKLTKGFYMGQTQVTEGQWKAVMGSNTRYFKGDDNLPVEKISWHSAAGWFCAELSRKEGRQYRLPTEAEWEYACRAGTTTPFNTGNTISADQANYRGNAIYGPGREGEYRGCTTPVGTFAPNKWGLYDMHGNVYEWCSDWCGDYPQGTVTDPPGPGPEEASLSHVLRGGYWNSHPLCCRSASRAGSPPGPVNFHGNGFRVCLDSGSASPPILNRIEQVIPSEVTITGGMKLVYIPPGEFMMGSPEDEEGRGYDERQHRVKLTRGFYMGQTQVTQAQWKTIMGDNPSHFKDNDNCPVECVSWDDAVEFCRKMSLKEGKQFRLPTEAEWEYACRAGTTGPYAGTGLLEDMGWHGVTGSRGTRPVGTKKPNALGLYDMHGNVWELCNDWYGDYPEGRARDPTGPREGVHRVHRGGSWIDYPWGCRSAIRSWDTPDGRAGGLSGFRVCLYSFAFCSFACGL